MAFNIPFLSVPDRPISQISQEHIPIADITEDLVIYKNGGCSIALESTSLNFSLLSEREQEAVIASYAAWLNSLTFPIQIVVRSQKKDITNYLNYLNQLSNKIKNQKLISVMSSYKKFISETIKKKNVLGKTFYIILPFSPLELGIAKSFASVTKGSKTLPFPKSYVIKKSKIMLYPRRDHLIRQADRLGIRMRQLSTNELIKLYYDIYNPEVIQGRVRI
jgi:hypothetical protein